MRIAIVTESWAPSVDGVVTRLVNTVRSLQEIGHQVMVIAPTVGADIPGVAERRTRKIALPWLYGGREWALPDRSVGRWLREFHPDVVHVVNPVCMGALAGRRTARSYPVLVSYHTDVAAYAANYRLGWLSWAIRALMRRVYRTADVRLATSDVGAAQLAELGIGDARLWPRAVDTKLFRADRDGRAARARLGGDPTDPLALYVGRLAAEKGCQDLLGLTGGEPAVRLALVGDGPDRARLEQLFAGSRATFTGFLHGEELADAYAAADVFVFPSTTDTLGLVLLEAMATGLPVVAYDTPAAAATLAGYRRAVLLPPGAGGVAWRQAVHQARALPRGEQGDRASGDRASGDRATNNRPTSGDWPTVTRGLVEHYRDAIAGHDQAGRPSRRRRVGRFAAVGATNAAIDLGAFNALVAVNPTRTPGVLVVYNTIAVLLALTNSYLWNSRWTFADRAAHHGGRRWRQRGLFGLQGGVNLAVNDLTIFLLSLVLRPVLGLPVQVASNLSKVAAMGTASATSYLMMHQLVFRGDNERAGGSSADPAEPAPAGAGAHDAERTEAPVHQGGRR